MDLSFREKSIAASLLLTLVLFAYYFSKVFKVLAADSSESVQNLPAVLIGVVVMMVVVEAVFHTVIAIAARGNDRDDERDRLIEAKATRIAYFVLVAGCVTTIGHATLSGLFPERVAPSVLANPIMTANLVLFSFILAEITGFTMQLVYYRRGV